MNLKELKLKYSNRAIMIFETLTDKPFSIANITDQYIFYYSVLMANNAEFNLSFNDFIDELDNDEELIPHLTNWFMSELKIKQQFSSEKKTSVVNQ